MTRLMVQYTVTHPGGKGLSRPFSYGVISLHQVIFYFTNLYQQINYEKSDMFFRRS